MKNKSQKTKDWEIKKLGDVEFFSVDYGTRVVKKRDGGTIYDVYGGGGKTFFMDTFNRENALVVARFAMSERCTRFVTGKFFLNDSGLTVSIVNRDFMIQEYLNYNFLFLNEYIYSLGHGSAQRNLNVNKFKEIEISFPKSLDEQKRVVGILDEAFENINQAKAIAEQNLKNIEELFNSELQNIFSNDGEGWERNTLGEVCEKTSNIKWSENINKDFKYVDLSAVSRENFKITDFVMVTSENAPSRAKRFIQTGDIIFATTRPTLKRVSMITEDYNNQICSTGFAVLRSNKKMIDKSLIFYFIQSNYFMDFMEKMQRGASYPAVSDSDVKSIQISYPKSLDEQGKIVERLGELKERVDEGSAILLRKIAALDELKKSLLQKAFNGEL